MGDSRTTGGTGSDNKKPKKARSPKSTFLYIGSVIILVIVVVTFVGVPAAGGFSQAGGSLVFGRYAGEEIAYRPGNFFARQYETIAQMLRDSSGDLDLDLQLRIAWRQAFNRAILRAAILHNAERSGMRVSETRIDELIASDPRFRRDGRFDPQAYRTINNQERLTLRSFHAESEIFNLFVDDVLEGSVSSNAEREFVASMAGPERAFNVVRFPFDEFPQAQVSSYAEENEALFSELSLSSITLASRDEAERIRGEAAQPGNPFEELARTYSRDPYADRGGEIGRMWGYEVQQELLDPDDLTALLSLEAGELSDPLETTAGWAFFRADATAVPFDPDNQAALDEALSYMQMFEQGRIQDFVREEAREFAEIAGASDLVTAAAEADRAIQETSYFPINYGNSRLFNQVRAPGIPEMEEAANQEQFFLTAFSLGPDEVSEPVMLRRSAVVLSLRGEREADADTGDFISNQYDAIVAQFQSDEIETVFVEEDKLEDNFLAAFNRYVLGNN